jgi:hypothetical protein
VFVLLYGDGWRLIIFCLFAQNPNPARRPIYFHFNRRPGRYTEEKCFPITGAECAGEMMSERELRGEDKGCERCSFCTLLADLNKRRKINNTPRGCLSSSVCSTRSLAHSLSLTHTGYFSPFGARIYYYFPRHAQSYFQLLHTYSERAEASLTLSHPSDDDVT